MNLKFWKKAPSAKEQLEEIDLEMYDEAMRLEKARSKRKRTYEI
jgi:SHS2 domain-containing protein